MVECVYDTLGKWKRQALSLLFPWSGCLCCTQKIGEGLVSANYLKEFGFICPACKSALEVYSRCDHCGTFMLTPGHKNQNTFAACHFCKSSKPEFLSGAVGFAPYKDQLRKNVRALKYDSKRGLARPMGEMTARAVLQKGWKPDAVVAVPLHPLKQQNRGYNQAHLLALSVADFLNLPYLNGVVLRSRDTSVQNKLTRTERQANVKNAFEPGPKSERLRGKAILLVDDIITSGSTLSNCAEILLGAGAAAVYGCGLATALETDPLL